jgi:hypothetical protein
MTRSKRPWTAKCVVVVWSRHSVKSRWVRAEAAEGERRSILIPVQIESAMLPLEFRRLQTPQLIGWTGASQHPELLTLLRAIREVLGTAHDSTQLPSPAPAAMAMESQRKSPRAAVGHAKGDRRMAICSRVSVSRPSPRSSVFCFKVKR